MFALDALITGVETREPVLYVFHPSPPLSSFIYMHYSVQLLCNRVKVKRITLHANM